MQRPMVVPPNIIYRNDMDDPKAALRRLFRSSRKAFVDGLSAIGREKLERDLAGLVVPLLAGHSVISSYAAVGSEIDPRAIEDTAHPISLSRHGPGPGVAFPRVTGRVMVFHAAARAGLHPRNLGIPEPDASTPQVTPGLLLVPLLSVTAAGVRLGQGGGYYDRRLRSLRADGPVTAIGLAWDVQLTDALPREPWDELLDWVRNNAETTYHPVGTCKMGHDPMAVVDDQLRVHGVQGLRVADASIMPTLTSGNTNAPSIMIGEKASRMMLAPA